MALIIHTHTHIYLYVYNMFLFILQCLGLTGEKLVERSVDFVDIAYDEVSPKHYKEEEVYNNIFI